jgi:hypothetical protein
VRAIIIHEVRKCGKEIIVHYLYSGTVEFSLHCFLSSTPASVTSNSSE